jgi:hypothetical protein
MSGVSSEDGEIDCAAAVIGSATIERQPIVAESKSFDRSMISSPSGSGLRGESAS